MPSHPRRALLATLLIAAVPAAALAQDNAGDEQYSDPLPPHQPSQQRSSQQQSSSQPTQSQSQGSSSAGQTTSQAPAAGSQASQPRELARTGADLRLPLAIGFALLLGGVALLRLSRRPARN